MTAETQIDAAALVLLGLAGRHSLTELLDAGFRLQDLRALARSRGWKLQGTSKQAVIEQIIARHQADEEWTAALRRLPVGQRLLFQQMWVAGACDAGIESYSSYLFGQGTGLHRGSLFQEISQAQLSVQSFIPAGDRFFLWPDVYRSLPLDASWLAPLAETQQFRRVAAAEPLRLALSAHRLVDYLARNRLMTPHEYSVMWSLPSVIVPISSHRRGSESIADPQPPLVPLAELARLAAGLELGRLDTHLLLLAMTTLGLIERQSSGQVITSPEALDNLRRIELSTLAQHFVRALLVTPLWVITDSLFPSPPLRIGNKEYQLGSAITQESLHGRQVMARVLLLLEPGVWYSLAELWHCLKQMYSFLTLAHRGSAAVYLTEDGRRLDASKDSIWPLALQRIYSYLLTGPFHHLGLVDLAYDGDEATAFRLAPFCRYLLGLAAMPDVAASPSRPGRIHFDAPNFFQTRNASPALHIFLSKVAAPGQGGRGQAGYLLSQARLGDSLAKGEDLDNLLKALAEVCDGPLPDGTIALLRGWAATYGHYHAHTDLTLIEFGDDLALPELLRSTDLAVYLRRQFGPRLIAIERRHAGELLQRLMRQGYTPTYSAADPNPP